jgi:hypothetical protein
MVVLVSHFERIEETLDQHQRRARAHGLLALLALLGVNGDEVQYSHFKVHHRLVPVGHGFVCC